MFCSGIMECNECFTHKKWNYLDIKRPYNIIYYIISGEGYFRINGKCEQFKKGHLYIFPTDTPFSLFDNENDKIYHMYLHVFINPKLNTLTEIDVENDDFLKSTITLLRKYINKNTPYNPNIYTTKTTEMLISYISDIMKPEDSAIHSQIKAYLDKNYIEVFKKNNLSKIFGYSNSQLTKLFKTAYNTTPNKYCVNLVLKYSIELLSSGYSSKEISNLLDFSSPASFSRFFKTYYGASPSYFIQTQHYKTGNDNSKTDNKSTNLTPPPR